MIKCGADTPVRAGGQRLHACGSQEGTLFSVPAAVLCPSRTRPVSQSSIRVSFAIIKPAGMTTTLQASSTQGPATPSSGGDVRAEFRALFSSCGVYDLSGRSKIRLTGADRVRWLNGMVTNNIRDLAVNHGVYAFLLNAQGHIQADLYAYNMGDSLLLDIDARLREVVLAHFDKFIIMDDVEVADISATLTAIGVAGPRAKQVLEKAGIHIPDLAPLELCTPTCNCACGCLQCTVVRSDVRGDGHGEDPAGSSYEIWLAPDMLKPAWDALVAAGATAVSADALERRRISHGIPRYGVDIRERDLPQETGQMRALSFTKGCYLGQEIVERIRSRGAVHRQFTAFLVEGPLPAPGTKIQADEKDVGEITSSADLPLPSGDRAVAFGYIRREAAGKNLRAGTAALKSVNTPIS
jgi:folate-binding protein YgfZ